MEAQVGVREAYLTEYMELLGNQTLEETVCKSLFYSSSSTVRILWLILAQIDGLWPNPFTGLNISDANLQSQKLIYLVDGSEYGQVRRSVFLFEFVAYSSTSLVGVHRKTRSSR